MQQFDYRLLGHMRRIQRLTGIKLRKLHMRAEADVPCTTSEVKCLENILAIHLRYVNMSDAAKKHMCVNSGFSIPDVEARVYIERVKRARGSNAAALNLGAVIEETNKARDYRDLNKYTRVRKLTPWEEPHHK